MSHRRNTMHRKFSATPAMEKTIRHATSIILAGLVLAGLSATAIADDRQSAQPVDVAFVLDQLATDEYSAALPPLSPDEFELLQTGEPVIKVPQAAGSESDDEVSAFGIFGLKIVDAPRLLVWSTVMGAASEPHVRLTRAYISRLEKGAYVRYQHINLPWPVRDRHWVILCEKNLDLANASNGGIWQHRWTLHEDGPQLLRDAHADGRIDGLSEKDLENAVYLPANRGAWTLAELGDGKTLVIGYFDASFGGLLPGMIVRSFTRRQMRAGLTLIEDLTGRVHLEYDGEPQIHDGHGLPILQQDVLRLAQHRDASGQHTADE